MSTENDAERFEGAIFAFKGVVCSGFPEMEEKALRALSESEDLDSILAGITSVMFAALEVRSEKMQFLYEQGGLRGLLKGLGLNDDERLVFINKMAGVEVAHQRLSEFEPLDEGPRSIFEITVLTQLPDMIVDDLLNSTFGSEEEWLNAIEERGYTVAEGNTVETPEELQVALKDFDLQRHVIINEEGMQVAAIGVLKGNEDRLNELNRIIKERKGNK